MKRFFNLFISLFIMLYLVQVCYAEAYKVLVLPDNIQFDSTNYLVYPDASVMFATDTINELKKNGKIQTVSMTEIRDTLRKNTHINLLTKKALKEFKYNYNIPFVDFKAIANYFSTNKILVITSQTDVQNYFLRRTLWDALNIPGRTVVDPAYKMSTYAALIDVDKEQVIWQNTYYKNISSMESRMIAQNFAPATEQLQKVKFYSLYYLSPDVARMVQARILPQMVPNQNNKSVIDVSIIETKPVFDDSINLQNKIVIPERFTPSNFGANVNDL